MASNGDPKNPGIARDFIDKWHPDPLKFPEQPDVATQAGSFIREALTGPPEVIAQLYSQLPLAVAQIVNEIVGNPLETTHAAAEIAGQFAPEELATIAESLAPVLQTVEIAELASPQLPSTVHIPTPEIDPAILWPQPIPPINVPPSTGSNTVGIKQFLLSGKGIGIAASLVAAGLLSVAILGKLGGNDPSDLVGTWKAEGQTLTITNTAGVLGGTISAQEVKCDNDTGGSCDQDHPEPVQTWPLTSVSFDGHNVSITFDYSHPYAMEGYQHRMVTIQGHLSDNKLIINNGGVLLKAP